MIPLPNWSDADLAAINLFRDEAGLAIQWEPTVNIHDVTLGRHIGPVTRDRTALIYEAPDGTVARQSFAEVDRAATGLAAALRARGSDAAISSACIWVSTWTLR